ncbi:type II CAAX endopeptidase family protein [Caldifermentibacillus hisashii]|nr:type II CAAX endopeptidase family protein [Caldibacillus thermoamylovorans]MCM3478327.1 CPBP family intramembrane metalloprotease [Caldibacillus thermoamylovorans]
MNFLKREYKLIIFTYVAMQLFLNIGASILYGIFQSFGFAGNKYWLLSVSIWTVFSFFVTLLITLYYLKDEITVRNRNLRSIPFVLGWSVYGVLLALIAQRIAIMIETLLGVDIGSENTENILNLINVAPIMIFVTSIIGPILEEIIFRKIIFGSLYKKTNFFLAALISSILFSAAHMEFEHLLLYCAIGFTFSYLYVKTDRIIIPILAHTLMNTYVVMSQFFLQMQQI